MVKDKLEKNGGKVVNKTTMDLQNMLRSFIIENFSQFEKDYHKIENPKVRRNIYQNLVQSNLQSLLSVPEISLEVQKFIDELKAMANEDNLYI